MMTFWLMGKTTTIAWRIKRMDMLWACVIDFRESWIKYLPLIGFAYNTGYYVTIGMLPYETLYEQKCQSLS
jgi:hypothetical protein